MNLCLLKCRISIAVKRRARILIVLGIVVHSGITLAKDNGLTLSPSGDFLERLGNSHTVFGALLGPDNRWDTTFGDWQAWKKSRHLPITIGAYNWYHVNNGGPAASGYGIPGLRGTYFWYVTANPQLSLNDGVIHSFGAHVDFRFRDTADKFRSFFNHTYWFYEAYGYADTKFGRLKAGRISKRFGLDWDGTWWGNVQYFDGFKLAPDDGFSWENTWHFNKIFRLDSFVQYFIAPSNISGSLAGANPQSVPGSSERNVGVIRVVPTWQLTDQSSLAVGFSALAGKIRNMSPGIGDDNQFAWAADITYRRGELRLFGEIDHSSGVLNQNRFVSGGPSDRITDLLTGISYKYGPITYRIVWSAGFDSNPSGHQYLWVPGITVAVTKNINFILDYVHWDVTDQTDNTTKFEDGFQLVLHWHL